jgi:hypothetical protein
MKKIGRGLAATLLFLALTGVAYAGQTEMPLAPPPSGATGQIDTPPANTSVDTVTVDALADFALDIWQFMPSLF